MELYKNKNIMTEKTKIIDNKKIQVRILMANKIVNVDEEYFNQAFRRIEGDLTFDMGVPSFGSTSVEKYTFTTLTNKELEEKFILF